MTEDKKDVYTFLDNLRESGVTNMFGSGSYVEDEYSTSKTETKELVVGWMKAVESGEWDMEKHKFTEENKE
jgi:hypothetical protein